MVLIKKYGNRRLYDTGDSRYVTLDELAGKIRSGSDLRVVDAQTGEDLTQATLTQIVLETGNAAKFLPVQLLTQMIRLSDDALAEFFSRYVTGALDLYLQAKRGVQTIATYNPLTQIPMAAGDALARMWMGGFGGGAPYQQYPGYTAPPPYPVPAPEDETLEEDSPTRKRPKTEPEKRAKTEPPAGNHDRADDVAAMRRELEELKQVLKDNLPKRKKRKP
ncbi:MAG TPA: polyhydroxyalkanoate synthesis regulator DNA-binding domain-containing protein [Kofleriaceae bacterium]|nr:polyhydroxyalkanoate synthesis regulator DNA-binding domain-containing protein [Kofleriaceae bacterium]